ncbi:MULTISPECIES: prohibitin family protein [Nonlabens]|uniref:Peptidase n=1 Tax=Nonlabens agnitus TaxID=870484 RepID=A0A2S9WSR7_9FLAO|nr:MULTISPECIES: prohibitin family protein [Nonlabens]KQC33644.1 peptidase [Nonlabens sp. YIK11]PRP66528.1 peptidase [Nonlabens agnitus]
MERLPRAAIFIIIGVVLFIIVLIKSAVVIDAGQAGVLFKLSDGVELENTYGEGFQIIAPWNDMIIFPVRQLSISDRMNVLSVNGLEVSVDATVWYQPEYDKLPYLYKEKGRDYVNEILSPAISAAARSVVGRYTPEQLYSSKRDVIQAEILDEVRKELESQYVQVNRVLVKDVTLPEKIKEAIERKLRQEQESLEYEFRLTKATKEAERQKIDAEGKAVANQILSASLTDKILTEKGIEATLKLAESPNAKVVVVGSGDSGLPIILGNQ